jgi:hypothetical protein
VGVAKHLGSTALGFVFDRVVCCQLRKRLALVGSLSDHNDVQLGSAASGTRLLFFGPL